MTTVYNDIEVVTSPMTSPLSNLTGNDEFDLNDIINGLDTSGVDDLDISQFLSDGNKVSNYYERDLAALNSLPSSLLDPYANLSALNNINLFSSETNQILKPLLESTTVIPTSEIVWPENTLQSDVSSSTSEQNLKTHETQTYAQYWGNKRNIDNSLANATNFEIPSKSQLAVRNDVQTQQQPQPLKKTYGGFDSLTPTNKENSLVDAAPRKRKLNSDEKNEKRRLQTRTASKLYRQRRKDLETQLQERLDQLEHERNTLLNEKKAADELLNKLKDENQKLRSAQKISSETMAKDRYELLVKLQKQVSENASDAELCSTIEAIKKCCKSCMEIGKCNLQNIINPGSVQQLISAGFFENINIDLAKKGTIEDLVAKIKTELGKSLTPEQEAKIDKEVYAHNEKIEVVLKEREVVTEDINRMFKAAQAKPDETITKSKEIISSLEHLRKSLADEAKLWTASMETILDHTLTPLQMAMFFLRVEFQHRSVLQLNTFWSALNKTLNLNENCPTRIKKEGECSYNK